MAIGLIELEPVVNTAYMQISRYHKQQGDAVEWWMPLEDSQFDVVYCSSLFTATNKMEVPKHAICGGTGYDLTTMLPPEIEACDYDYSIYPNCDFSIVWFSRGCTKDCSYCIVRQKEGYIHAVDPKPLNPKGKYIVVQDNSFFANPKWEQSVEQLRSWGQPVEITNIDVRDITDEQCKILAGMKHAAQIKIAWDNPREDLKPHFEKILRHIKAWRIMVYVLIGYWSTPEEDLYRVETIKQYGMDPWVMPYDRRNPYQKRFTRWGRPIICQSCKWEDYR
jgi:hypothetical protein